MLGLGTLVPIKTKKGKNMSKVPRLFTGFLLSLMCATVFVLAAVGVHRFVRFSDTSMNWYVSFGFVLALLGAIAFQMITYLQIAKK